MLIINLQTGEYPITEEEFRRRFPRVPEPIKNFLREYGYDRVYERLLPDHTVRQATVEVRPQQIDGWRWFQHWIIVDLNEKEIEIKKEKIRGEKLSGVKEKRDRLTAAGVSFAFPDGVGIIQTRDEKDFRNLNGLSASALALVGQSVTLPFRDQENVVHWLTPTQMIGLGLYVMQKVQAIYSASWVHNDVLAVMQDIEALQAYDIESGWPE